MKLQFQGISGYFYLTQINDVTNKIMTFIGSNITNFFNVQSLTVGVHDFPLTNGNYLRITRNATNYDFNFYLSDNTGVMYQGISVALTNAYRMLGVSEYDGSIVGLSTTVVPVAGNVASVYVGPGTLTSAFYTWANGSYLETFPGAYSDDGGGTGEFDDTSDEIDFPDLPSFSATSTGFITVYSPTLAQLKALSDYMWSSSFDINTFKKLFADPMEAIIGLSIVPVSVPTGGAQNITIGAVDTGVAVNLASTQYVTVDCGSITIPEYWGSALDYSPYTKFSIYLPYIGTRQLNTDDIMNTTVQIIYRVDVLSGSCTALIKCGGSVLYEFSGACASAVPVTGQNWTQLITSCIQLAGAGIAVAASSGSAAGLLPSTVNAVMSMKPDIQRTGAVSGAAGFLGIQTPYLICELPRQSLAKGYNTYVGYPSNITALLSTLTGYTQVERVQLNGIPATSSELQEIETLLQQGVII